MKLTIGNDFSAEELAVLTALAGKLGIQLAKSTRRPVGNKILLSTTYCDLCKTITNQYIKMTRFSDNSWEKECELSKEEVESSGGQVAEHYKATVRACWACKGVLMGRSKEELIDMILKLYDPRPSQSETWKKVVELRSTPLRTNIRA